FGRPKIDLNQDFGADGDRALGGFVAVLHVYVQHHGDLPSSCGARLAMVGHSTSIMIIAGPIISNACATVPSDPSWRTHSSSPNVCVMKSTAAPGSRHTNLGVTTDAPSGIGLTLAHH
ncbi:MAG TPA: hypothetical protein VFS12_05440, partial [Terriglobia bacterium]|nr:hypothetical protein [Terriglobia bacterium]